MLTTLRKVGNSRGIIIPAALLVECRIDGAVEMAVEAGRLVITPVHAPRAGWFDGYRADDDINAWEGLPVDDSCEEWVW